MKQIDLNGITYISQVPYGTEHWYFGMDHDGDLYEAEEIYKHSGCYRGTSLYVIGYPEGEVFCLAEKAANIAVGEPVYYDERISFLSVDFEKKTIEIRCFDCDDHSITSIDELSLDSVKDCYNLRLHEHPLTLTRQANNGVLEMIWPLRKNIQTGRSESFFYRDENRLYFSAWHEDPDYREECIIRDSQSGQIIEKLAGDITVMPDGQLWHLTGK